MMKFKNSTVKINLFMMQDLLHL